MREYYEPQLLARILRKELREVRPLGELNRAQPKIVIDRVERGVLPDVCLVTLRAYPGERRLRRGGNETLQKTDVYDIHLFRDGQRVGRWPEPAEGDDNAPEPDPTKPEQMVAWQDANRVRLDASGKATRTFPVRLPRRPGSKVKFTAYAFNEDRVKSAATPPAAYEVPPGVPKAEPRAYVVAFGAAGFSDPAWDLHYAAADARLAAQKLGKALNFGAAGFSDPAWDLYQSANGAADARQKLRKALNEAEHYDVVPVVLATDRGTAGQPPRPGEAAATAANLRLVLDALAGRKGDARALAAIPGANRLSAATPDDLVILFASSHGYTDRKGAYYLFPSDLGPARAAGRSIDEERDTALLGACISSGELSAWLRRVDAGQLALIVRLLSRGGHGRAARLQARADGQPRIGPIGVRQGDARPGRQRGRRRGPGGSGQG